MWKKPSQLSWFYLLLMATAVPTPFAAAQTEPPPLLITEIYADTPGDDAAEEWLELTYFGEAPLLLAGYKIGDEESTGGGEGMMSFPEGAVIAPNEVIVIAQTAVGFRALFGQNPTYEMRESDPAVPNMLPLPSLATGEIGLANGGDEVLLLDANDEWLDAISYGDSTAVFAPVRAAPRGQSLERTPSPCDSDSAADWRVQPIPTPFAITPGECEQGTEDEGQVTNDEGQMTNDEEQGTNDQGQLTNDHLTIPIGQVQGSGETAALLGRRVTVRGIVTGLHSDQNLAGVVYHTFFMQDVPGTEDGDPATSDGLAVFSGRRWHGVAIGDEVLVTGNVLEFFGLTELDDAQLEIAVLNRGNPLPTPVELTFPLRADVPPAHSQRTTYEALEGMLVQLNKAQVLGGSYDGCGFAVARADVGLTRLVRPSAETDISWITPILYETDVACPTLPALKSGDAIGGLMGPLTYNFDQYKIVWQEAYPLAITAAPFPPLPQATPLAVGQISVATFNVENYFDTADDTGDAAEPKPTTAELTLKQTKLAHTITQTLQCPTLLAIIEVENAALLEGLALALAEPCGFRYTVSHLESYDGRGIDNALLSDPRRAAVQNVVLRQSCVPIPTSTGAGNCPTGQNWLFGRPPLEVELVIDGRALIVWVNHFKSKRGGEVESEPERLAQADYLGQLAAERLAANPSAALIALGDFNDYADSPTMQLLAERGQLTNVLRQLPPEEQYTFVFSGASQMIDGILLSSSLLVQVAQVQILHINADYPDQYGLDTSAEFLPYKSADHDPSLVVLNWVEGVNTPETAASFPWGWVAAGLVAASVGGGTAVLWHKRRVAS